MRLQHCWVLSRVCLWSGHKHLDRLEVVTSLFLFDILHQWLYSAVWKSAPCDVTESTVWSPGLVATPTDECGRLSTASVLAGSSCRFEGAAGPTENFQFGVKILLHSAANQLDDSRWQNTWRWSRTSALAAVEEARPTTVGDFGRKSKTSGGVSRSSMPLFAARSFEAVWLLMHRKDLLWSVVKSLTFCFSVTLQTSAGVRTGRCTEDGIGVARMV